MSKVEKGALKISLLKISLHISTRNVVNVAKNYVHPVQRYILFELSPFYPNMSCWGNQGLAANAQCALGLRTWWEHILRRANKK